MSRIALEALIAFLAFIAVLCVDHFRVAVLSRILFWKRRPDLMGTYVTSWIVEKPEPTSTSDGSKTSLPSVEDLARLTWASGSYISGTATSPRYGDYTFQGRTEGNAITLTYRAKEQRLRPYLGVIMLRIGKDGVLSGYWAQNRPDQAAVHVGTTIWTKRQK